ncbi:hypothetical protein COMA1_50178 [Candidatus Nitrospira nitrosa]|uniref:Uncharacterized protein n=1 Tax=Candidatus Nitrospira nitrosa TaxID=1742972 RepID=A0A0S4LLW8_9BACT|nr:hypothetical protein COMA1_50178 [Candidatus Nitrospira nitrosa]
MSHPETHSNYLDNARLNMERIFLDSTLNLFRYAPTCVISGTLPKTISYKCLQSKQLPHIA